jgi:hypothetical protein
MSRPISATLFIYRSVTEAFIEVKRTQNVAQFCKMRDGSVYCFRNTVETQEKPN